MMVGSSPLNRTEGKRETEQLSLRRETLQSVLDQCKRALEVLSNADGCINASSDYSSDGGDLTSVSSSLCGSDPETAELCDLLKSRVESTNFLEKLGSIHMSILHNMAEEGSSWDVISETDSWQGSIEGENESDQDGYFLVQQEDVVEGIACFMAAYILSLKQTKLVSKVSSIPLAFGCHWCGIKCSIEYELTPNQLQEALSKTFSVKKKKGKLQRLWDGSKVVYNVGSWSATAIGLYQNPVLYRSASAAFWTSCQVISKLL